METGVPSPSMATGHYGGQPRDGGRGRPAVGQPYSPGNHGQNSRESVIMATREAVRTPRQKKGLRAEEIRHCPCCSRTAYQSRESPFSARLSARPLAGGCADAVDFFGCMCECVRVYMCMCVYTVGIAYNETGYTRICL